MPHLKPVTVPSKATIIVQSPDTATNINLDGNDVVNIMESFFGFIFGYIEIKGKAAN